MPLFVPLLIFAALPADSASAADTHAREIPAALIKLIEQVDVSAGEEGILASLAVHEGQLVAEGAILAQLIDNEVRIAAERARIELAMARKAAENDVKIRFAKKSVEVAKAELQRSLVSVERYAKSISDSELDRLRLVVEKSALEAEEAEYEFQIALFTQRIKETECRAAQEKVDRHKIRAPLSGVVVQINRHRGEWVKPGDAVARILRLDRLRAEGFLKIDSLRPDLQNRQVQLSVAMPDGSTTEFPGKIVFLSPEVDPVNSQVRIWAEVENKDLLLRPGMRARLRIEGPPK